MHSRVPAAHASFASRYDKAIVLVLAAGAVAAALAIQAGAYPNHDVSYLTWVAHKVWHSAVYGRDIREVNPPLAFLIYAPAAWLGEGLGPAVRLWVAAIACLSLTTLSRAVPDERRVAVVAALGAFFAFGFPREFGQREQIALLLCAPYAAGPIKARSWAAVSGAMAGIGFALKPHFLIALLLVFLGRRRLGTEEKMIAAAGLAYAIILPLAFDDYLRNLPQLLQAYWGAGEKDYFNARVLSYALPAFAVAVLGYLNRDKRMAGFALASAGFMISTIVQGKFFPYHFVAPWGFLVLYLASQLAFPRWRWVGSLLLVTVAVQLAMSALPWVGGQERRNAEVAALVRAIDSSNGYIALSIHPYPAFPAAIYASRPYLGSSAGMGGLAAVGKLEKAGQPVPASLARTTLDQALAELDREPGLVIVQTDWSVFDDLSGFDGLRWLEGHAQFRRRWSRYAPADRVGAYRLFRRIS